MSSERLLIVDDEPEFGQFVRKVAEAMDFEVKVTTQVAHFKGAYGAFDPTVIVRPTGCQARQLNLFDG